MYLLMMMREGQMSSIVNQQLYLCMAKALVIFYLTYQPIIIPSIER
jgi:hypothetical protein